MKYLLIAFVLFSCNNLLSQAESKDYRLVLTIAPTYGYHKNKPIEFPLSYTDASITPMSQTYNIGYDISASAIKQLKNNFRMGVITYVSHFGFTESGEELNFWTNQTSAYRDNRSFTMLGVGIQSGYNLEIGELSMVNLNVGLANEMLLSKEGIFLWREEQNRTKYSLISSIEFGHKLSCRLNLLAGLNTRIGLKEYFDNIDYKPSRFGVHIGIEYSLN